MERRPRTAALRAALAGCALAAMAGSAMGQPVPQYPPHGPAAPGSLPPPPPLPPSGDLEYDAAKRGLVPLHPGQIKDFRDAVDANSRAAARPPGPPSRGVSRSVAVSLEPGARFPALRAAAGRVSSVSFYDMSGAPWPIEGYTVGNEGPVEVKRPTADGNLLNVSLADPYAVGNLSVSLRGQSEPVMVDVAGADPDAPHARAREFDARLDLRVEGFGPNARATVSGVGQAPASGTPEMMAFLDGVPPPAARPLRVSGGPGQAWRMGDRLYLRTRATVMSPSWLSTQSGAGGVNVYALPAVPVVMVSDGGAILNLSIAE